MIFHCRQVLQWVSVAIKYGALPMLGAACDAESAGSGRPLASVILMRSGAVAENVYRLLSASSERG